MRVGFSDINTQRLTCAASLFFQSPNRQKLCKRNFLFNYQQSTLIQHRNVWIYHFPMPQLTLRSPGNEASPPRTQVLVNAGLLFNSSACHVSTEDLRMYADLCRRNLIHRIYFCQIMNVKGKLSCVSFYIFIFVFLDLYVEMVTVRFHSLPHCEMKDRSQLQLSAYLSVPQFFRSA